MFGRFLESLKQESAQITRTKKNIRRSIRTHAQKNTATAKERKRFAGQYKNFKIKQTNIRNIS